MDKNHQVDAAILDFCKAFDKVNTPGCYTNLDYYGIRGNILHWLKSFLYNSTRQVVVDGSISSICKVTSGVPQGSVLGLMI